jgi:sulfur carrier protein
MITIQLNQQRVELADDVTLAHLVASLGKTPAALATAVNGDFIARERREQQVLRDGDIVLTFEPITGG